MTSNPKAHARPSALPGERLLTPIDVAKRLRVNPKTVSRWANAGRLKGIQTPGGHWRFHEQDVQQLLQDGGRQK
jgi:excisionase family DNA binding protein